MIKHGPVRQAILNENGTIYGWRILDSKPITKESWALTDKAKELKAKILGDFKEKYPIYKDKKIDAIPIRKGGWFDWQIILL